MRLFSVFPLLASAALSSNTPLSAQVAPPRTFIGPATKAPDECRTKVTIDSKDVIGVYRVQLPRKMDFSDVSQRFVTVQPRDPNPRDDGPTDAKGRENKFKDPNSPENASRKLQG